MTYQTRVWIHGAVAALIVGTTNAVVITVADPAKFNLFDGGASRLAVVALLAGVVGLAAFLKDKPLPDIDKDIDAVSAARVITANVAANVQSTGTGNGTTGPHPD